MRDLEQIQEADAARIRSRRGLLWMAGLTTTALVLSLGLLIGRATEPTTGRLNDPFASQRSAANAAGSTSPWQEEALVPVEPETLIFPVALTTRNDRSEVARSLRGTVAAGEARVDGSDYQRDSASDTILSSGATAPAATRATPDRAYRLSQAARDPLITAAQPRVGSSATAPAGRDGKYTLQIISYDDAEQAQAFATILRARGHKAFVTSNDLPEPERYWRVRIGPFASRARAEAYRRQFEAHEHMNTYVVRQPDRQP